jgi:hypothetical protein
MESLIKWHPVAAQNQIKSSQLSRRSEFERGSRWLNCGFKLCNLLVDLKKTLEFPCSVMRTICIKVSPPLSFLVP